MSMQYIRSVQYADNAVSLKISSDDQLCEVNATWTWASDTVRLAVSTRPHDD